jgi:predicted amidohydrolase
MRVAIYQCEPRPGDVGANLDRLAGVAEDAAAQGVQLLLCPEMFLSGYDIGASAADALAEPRDGDSAGAVARIARESRLAILYGYPERAPQGAVFNAVQLIGADGASLANYRKTHLFGELDRSMFSPSDDSSALVELNGWRLGLLICYDVEFPENARALALAGVDLIAAPTANMDPYEVVATTLVPARAYENQVYFAYANYCGHEGEISYCGQSCVAAPNGTDAARAGRDEALIVADLDREAMTASRKLNTYLADRRPELYAALTSTRTGRT